MTRSLSNTSATGLTEAQSAAITSNTAKAGVTEAQTAAITANTAKVAITNIQSSSIVANSSATSIVNNNVIPRITHLVNFPTFISISILASSVHSGLSVANGFPVARISSGFKAGSNADNSLVYEVQMRGCFGCTNSIEHGVILFNLPASYRPSQSVRISVSKGGSGPADLAILINGDVQYINSSNGGTSHIFLDGVRFYTK